MQYLGIEYQIKNLPVLDSDFIPFGVWARAYEAGAERPFKIAVERENKLVTVREMKPMEIKISLASASALFIGWRWPS